VDLTDSPGLASLLVAVGVFAGALAGLHLHRLLPAQHLTKETQDVVRLGTGMLSVLSSLVLAMLISTAKTTYDTTDKDLRGFSADLILLDETLRDYGDAAMKPRLLLRDYTRRMIAETWPAGYQVASLDDQASGAMLERVREAIRSLKPVDDGQRWLMDQALQVHVSLLRERWQFIQHEGPSVRPVVLAILVSWISFIFASFGLNAPRNGTVVAAFFVCSLAIGGSVYLVLAMDRPLSGLMRVPDAPMRRALAHMAPG
jgi:hypothetical protein